MKFVVERIYIHSKWFDLKGKGKDQKSFFSSNITVDGLMVYLMLHKFIMIGQDERFIYTSIELLSRESGLSTDVINHCLLMMEKFGVIKIRNKNKKKSLGLINSCGCLNPEALLDIILTDVPDYQNNKDDKFVVFETSMVEWMLRNKMNAKHVAAYHLLKKYSQGGNREIDYDSEYLGKHIGIPKSTMLRMLEDLNGAMLVKSEKKNNGKGGRKFIHRVLWEYGRWDIFKENRFSRGKIGTGTGS